MNAWHAKQRKWHDVSEGETIPTSTEALDVERVIAGATSTRTFFGGHIDPEYARSQGRSHIYMATGPILGLLDRYVTDWAGPLAFLRKRSVKMADSLYAGTTVRIDGVVARKWIEGRDGRDEHLVEIEMTIRNEADTACVIATSRFTLPAE
jgi:hypothetical protein